MKTTPTTFEQCQSTKCMDCTFSVEIPEDKQARHDYFEYCEHRKEFDME